MNEMSGFAQDVRTINVIDQPDASCPCVKDHNPNAVQFHVHHIIPLAWGGEDAPENEMLLCPTTHDNVHRLLREWRKAGGEPSWDLRKFFSPFVRELAERAYRVWYADQEPQTLLAVFNADPVE